ncbi:MAG: LLM class flavin-dependent oxidoreductase [Microterricola sp.]
MPQKNRMRFGTFMSPIHSARENPTLALHRDVETIVRLEELGYDEAWIGEHHSTGWEFVASPDMILSYAAARTSRIRLGAGVASLPYHHPLNVVERFVLLDHLSHGRAILGVGPGALAYDAEAIGLDPADARRRMEESLDVILRLLDGERVTAKTDWFTLERAALQLLPRDELEVVVAGTVSPNGPKLAGTFGKSLLTMTATTEAGFNVLGDHWNVVQEQSALHGQVADRSSWRMVGPMYIAETEEQALADVQRGLDQWCYYMSVVGGLPVLPKSAGQGNWAKGLVEAGFAVIGTPEQAIDQISRLYDQSGGFGTVLVWANDWAPQHKMLESYELFAREVMPAFDGSTRTLIEAEEWAISRKAELDPAMHAARAAARTQYEAERDARAVTGAAG